MNLSNISNNFSDIYSPDQAEPTYTGVNEFPNSDLLPPSNQQALTTHRRSALDLTTITNPSSTPAGPAMTSQPLESDSPKSPQAPGSHSSFSPPSPSDLLERAFAAKRQQSASSPPAKSSKIGKKKATTIVKKPRQVFTGPELLALVTAVVNIDPWNAPYGEKGKRWEQVTERVKNSSKKFEKLNRSANTYHSKVEALLEWHSEAEGHSAGTALIDQEIKHGGDVTISIGALLDKVSSARLLAAQRSDEAKTEARLIEQENNAGGASIRENAMKTLARQCSDHDNSDKENSSPKPPPAKQEDRRSCHDAAILEEYRTSNQNVKDFHSSLLGILQSINSNIKN
ncbi:hypothetical protein M422DRAFT_249376 [Sphaerobolus stellatus SS14]|uniref:Uncharacterized protein n=1 Tax=Sphaerobolus stellatus (strain SS14) TaxID=990650 RepID=A0A0C9UVJ3_SPHS4|nr:hypothetical protein M422DRAFT_249376 [Sphaerobolus stellatus SS14]